MHPRDSAEAACGEGGGKIEMLVIGFAMAGPS
jgi:hypothetical protein